MKKLFKTLAVFFITLTTIFATETLNLMPVPKSLELNNSKCYLHREFKIEIKSHHGDDLYTYATRILRRLDERTGLCFHQDILVPNEPVENAFLTIETQRQGQVKLYENESYELVISESEIKLNAVTDIGAMRGLETLLQLLGADENGYFFPTLKINDEPRFPWRGLMIDVARHFHDVHVIKRNIDGMAALKMNVLHLHLCDDQGFRIESKVFPKLHLISGEEQYFSQEQIKDIVRYAKARGIRVIPEFDVPGHGTSFIVAYPELSSSNKPVTLERTWGVHDPTLNPTEDITYKFLDQLFEEMGTLFPDEYFHIGGDENNGKEWSANEKIKKFMKDNHIPDNHALQTYFNKQILKILTHHQKKMIGWDEILQPELPRESVVHSWRGPNFLVQAVRNGYQTILSNGYYIDLIQPASYHYMIDPVPQDSNLTEEEIKFVLGGEATMWSEFVDDDVIDSRIWPRTAAIAERFWSPAEIQDIDDMYRRLEVTCFRLEEHGLNHIRYQEMFFRRLTNNQDTRPLKTLVDVIEMLKIYNRHRTFFKNEKYQSHTPLTRVVDATLPDPKIPREFSKLIDQYISSDFSPEYEQKIRNQLNLWKKNDPDLRAIAKKSPMLNEILPMSEKLTTMSEIGIKTLEYIKSQKKPSIFWKRNALKSLENCKEQVAGTELMVVAPIEKLVMKITD
ncbi:MAG: family 20 glycosylhydrolase [Candidatus Marinimicrobia bacterium]|nr:family 20 glycosylhydrolase [Candidatus Neomarinimicrobiota bacterium]